MTVKIPNHVFIDAAIDYVKKYGAVDAKKVNLYEFLIDGELVDYDGDDLEATLFIEVK